MQLLQLTVALNLIMSAERDVCAEGQGNEHCCGWISLQCEQISDSCHQKT